MAQEVNRAVEGTVLACTPTSDITCCAEFTPKSGTSAKFYSLCVRTGRMTD